MMDLDFGMYMLLLLAFIMYVRAATTLETHAIPFTAVFGSSQVPLAAHTTTRTKLSTRAGRNGSNSGACI